MKEIAGVEFEGNPIPAFQNNDHTIWFIAKPIYEALDYTWHPVHLDQIPDGWKRKVKIYVPSSSQDNRGGGKQMVWIINKPAFYMIVFGSKHPKAIAMAQKVSEFIDKIERDAETDEDMEEMRDQLQLFSGLFTSAKAQRPMNHKRNRESRGVSLGQFWMNSHNNLNEKSCQERRIELFDRFDIPLSVTRRSLIEGLRQEQETYWESIPHSLKAFLTLKGIDENTVDELIRESIPFFMNLGNLVAEKEVVKRDAKQEKMF